MAESAHILKVQEKGSTYGEDEHNGSRANCRITDVMTMRIRQSSSDETEEQADHDPAKGVRPGEYFKEAALERWGDVG